MTARRYTVEERAAVMRAVVAEHTEPATPEHIWHYETTVEHAQGELVLCERKLRAVEMELVKVYRERNVALRERDYCIEKRVEEGKP